MVGAIRRSDWPPGGAGSTVFGLWGAAEPVIGLRLSLSLTGSSPRAAGPPRSVLLDSHASLLRRGRRAPHLGYGPARSVVVREVPVRAGPSIGGCCAGGPTLTRFDYLRNGCARWHRHLDRGALLPHRTDRFDSGLEACDGFLARPEILVLPLIPLGLWGRSYVSSVPRDAEPGTEEGRRGGEQPHSFPGGVRLGLGPAMYQNSRFLALGESRSRGRPGTRLSDETFEITRVPCCGVRSSAVPDRPDAQGRAGFSTRGGIRVIRSTRGGDSGRHPPAKCIGPQSRWSRHCVRVSDWLSNGFNDTRTTRTSGESHVADPVAVVRPPHPGCEGTETFDRHYANRIMLLLAGVGAVVLYIEGMLTPVRFPMIEANFGVDTAQADRHHLGVRARVSP